MRDEDVRKEWINAIEHRNYTGSLQDYISKHYDLVFDIDTGLMGLTIKQVKP